MRGRGRKNAQGHLKVPAECCLYLGPFLHLTLPSCSAQMSKKLEITSMQGKFLSAFSIAIFADTYLVRGPRETVTGKRVEQSVL